jgi:iron complex transport system permease protein
LKNPYTFFSVFLLFLAVILFVFDLSIGQIHIPFAEVIKSLFGENTAHKSWEYIIFNYRLPKAITAVLVGIGLSVSGLLMQTFFRNPMAGPYVLGVTSGSSLGVAIVVMGSFYLPLAFREIFTDTFGIIIASFLGSFFVFLSIIIVSSFLKDTNAILIVGLMFTSFTTAIVSILTYYSTEVQLQKFTFWSLGSLGNLSWYQVLLLAIVVLVGLALTIAIIKPLDLLLLGENYAKSMGLNYNRIKFIIIIITSVLAGGITAFAGPIAFVGLAVPHITKIIFRSSNHKILFFGTILLGSIMILLCDLITQLPTLNFVIPVNAITSIIGAPVVIWLLLKKYKN